MFPCRETDGQTAMKQLIVSFRIFAKGLKNDNDAMISQTRARNSQKPTGGNTHTLVPPTQKQNVERKGLM